MTAYDRQTFARTLAMAVTLAVLAYGVMLATDGALTTAGQKLGRLAVLAPGLGALGALLAATQSSMRGETRALEALGVHPSRACLGALAGLGLTGGVGVLILWTRAGDATGLFPRLQLESWSRLGDGSWRLAEAGFQVSPEGEPSLLPAIASTVQADVPHAAVVLSVAWMTVVLVDWVRDELGAVERLVAALVSGAVAIGVFHGVAARELPPWGLMVAPVPLILHAWTRRAFRRWR